MVRRYLHLGSAILPSPSSHKGIISAISFKNNGELLKLKLPCTQHAAVKSEHEDNVLIPCRRGVSMNDEAQQLISFPIKLQIHILRIADAAVVKQQEMDARNACCQTKMSWFPEDQKLVQCCFHIWTIRRLLERWDESWFFWV